MTQLGRTALTAAATLVLAGLGVFVFGGFWDLTAVRQHPAWVFHGIALGRDTVIAVDAANAEVPDGFEPAAEPEGAALFQEHCAQCHGAPGIAPADFALGMMPVPSNLAGAARRRSPEEVYWFIRYGLKMSGMPAWEYRMSEADMWRVAALVKALPALSPVAYAELLDAAGGPAEAVRPVSAGPGLPTTLGDPETGREMMQLYACRSCHLIEGIVGKPDLRVGPSLDEAGDRRYIAGVLPNTPENMVRWLMDPQEVDPLSAMPDLGVTEAHARHMAAYLYAIAEEPPLDIDG